MSKYQFHRMSGDTFQQMVQALLESKYRSHGQLTQFPSYGPDGGREATWTQAPTHPDYVRPSSATKDVPKHWVFQVKFHDIGLRGWSGAASALASDLRAEVEKITSTAPVPCHHYVLITNVPLTGARRIGGKDRLRQIASDLEAKIPSIEIWDAADLSRMLDADPGVRTSYDELILPGDVLGTLLRAARFDEDRRAATLRGYLKAITTGDARARAEEADEDAGLPLAKVFVDQTLSLDTQCVPECYREVVDGWMDEQHDSSVIPHTAQQVSSGFPLLWGAIERVMLLAGPGYGKSTITQFLALYHASRIVDPVQARQLAERLKLPSGWGASDLDAASDVRIPFRIELRRYAKWRRDNRTGGIGAYIAARVIRDSVESALDAEDIFFLVATNAAVLILDGLDEVPSKDDRITIIGDYEAFLNRCSGENVNLQVVVSSRPQGYHGEFSRFQPLQWTINDLDARDFFSHCRAWLAERIPNLDERKEAEERIHRGMRSDAVRRLATTLLQATVMLTIVRRKSDIPEERHKLYNKYVDVVFQRESTKNELISQYERELRLLHETVGYRIHESLARGEHGVMPEAQFKQLVLEVWRLLRGDLDLQGTTLNNEIRRICEFSTDRLVFLTGKGANQSDIDFVIQPYREYFAASYLSNHTSADPHKVLAALVARGAYWQQVLRFYAAFIPAAQQLAWTLEAGAATPAGAGPESLTESARMRRATLLTLPEFTRFHFDQFQRAIRSLLPVNEWWTWLGQTWAVPLLRDVHKGNGWRALWLELINAPIRPYGANAFAIALFPSCIQPTSPEYLQMVDFLRDAIQAPETTREAIQAAFIFGIPECLNHADTDKVCEALSDTRFRRRHGSLELHPDRAQPEDLRFICTLAGYYGNSQDSRAWKHLGTTLRHNVQARIDYDPEVSEFLVIRTALWCGPTTVLREDIQIRPSYSEASIPYAEYLSALLRAIEDPADFDAHVEAWESMGSLPQIPIWALRCEQCIGPHPASFASREDWAGYHSSVRALFADDEEYEALQAVVASFAADGSQSRLWTLLLFSPSQWPSLVAAGIISAEGVGLMSTRAWARAASFADRPIDLVSHVHGTDPEEGRTDVPFVELMNLACDHYTASNLHDSPISQYVLGLTATSSVRSEDVNLLARRLLGCDRFPAGWMSAFFEVALRVEGTDATALVELWTSMGASLRARVWGRLGVGRDWNAHHTVIDALLSLDNDDALHLLADTVASQWSRMSEDLSCRISRRLATAIGRLGRARSHAEPQEQADGDEKGNSLIRCLFGTLPTDAEAALFHDADAIEHTAALSPYFFQRFRGRIASLPESLSGAGAEPSVWRPPLLELIRHRERFPVDVVAAAIDTLLQLETSGLSPLRDEDWLSE